MLPPVDDLVSLLRHRVAEPDGAGFTFIDDDLTEAELTYQQLDVRARRIAAKLQSLGARGKRVVILYPPGLEYIAAFFGALYAGAVAVPAYPPDPSRLARTLPRLQAQINDSDAEVVLTSSLIASMTDFVFAHAPALAGKAWIATDQLPDGGEDEWRRPEVDAGSLAFLQYTSGSTGEPKGVMLSHGNLIANLHCITRSFQLSRHTVGVSWLPPYHDMGLIGGILGPLANGCSTALMSPLTFLRRPLTWLEAITRFRGTTSGGPNFAFELCVRKIGAPEREGLDLGSWELAFCGAEPIRRGTIESFVAAFAPHGFRREAFYACYGLAESTLIATGGVVGGGPRFESVDRAALARHEVLAAPEGAPSAVSIVGCGQVVPGHELRIVDPASLTPRADGGIGEIWLSGPSVSSGYWNRPADSKERLDARIVGGPDRGFLRTGDLGYVREGELFVTGRLKELLIIRGSNHYPQDIERVVEDAHGSIRRGGTAAFTTGPSNDEVAVAAEVDRRFYERRKPGMERVGSELRVKSDRRRAPEPGLGADAPTPFDPSAVAEAIRRRVASEIGLTVSKVVLLKPGDLPKTSSGKVQRLELRAQLEAGALDPVSVVEWPGSSGDLSPISSPPSIDEIEEMAQSVRSSERLRWFVDQLRQHIARLLGVKPEAVDVDASLPSLGLDSLMAVEVVEQLGRSANVSLKASELLADTSIAKLASVIHARRGEKREETAVNRLHPAPVEYPATPGQASLWFLEQLHQGPSRHGLSCAFRAGRDLDITALRAAFQALVNHHPALRTGFLLRGDDVVARTTADVTVRFEQVDAVGWDTERLRRFLRARVEAPFQLDGEALLRVHAAAVEDGWRIAVVIHHLAIDFWSFAIVIEDLAKLYRALRAQTSPALSPLRFGMPELSKWQQAMVDGRAGARALEFWRAQLADVESTTLALPRDEIGPASEGTVRITLPDALVARVRAFARAEGATTYTVLLSAFQRLLHIHTGQDDLVVGSPFAGRAAAFDDLVGYVMNAVPLRSTISATTTAREHVQATRARVMGALEHHQVPFAAVHERLGPARATHGSGWFEAFFTFNRSHLADRGDGVGVSLAVEGSAVALDGARLEVIDLGITEAPFLLAMTLGETETSIVGRLDFASGAVHPALARRLAIEYVALLDRVTADPAAVPRAADLVDDEQRLLLVGSLASGGVAPTVGRAVTADIDDVAARTPKAVAVSGGGRTMTYEELRRASDAIAASLVSSGVGSGEHVGLLARRSPECIAGLLGILKAGAVYVPLDPAFPVERLRLLTDEARLKRVVAGSATRQLATELGVSVMPLDDLVTSEARLPSRTATGEAPAYVVFTSGSTGRPRGVVVSHGNLAAYSRIAVDSYHLGPEDRCLQFASLTFDASFEEIIPTLQSGARLELRDDEMLGSIEVFLGAVERLEITVLNLPTAYWHEVVVGLRDGARLPPSVRLVIIGGERALPERVEEWRARAPSTVELVNTYGPTEATIVTTSCVVAGPTASTSARDVPIGRPVAGTQAFVLDEELRVVPRGVVGELCLGGPQVALGYLGDEAATAARFPADPFGRAGRLYRTGDRVRWREDGLLAYLGRIDHQVKIRGFRVEPGEVAAVMRQHAGVEDVAVVAHDRGTNDRRLVAYVVPRGDILDTSGLARFARANLPPFMVPWVFMQVARLPRTSSGKLDTRALPAPVASQLPTAAERVAPRSDLEGTIARVWSDVLGVEGFGIDDEFFDLGGHSLQATKIASRLRAELGASVPLAALFEHTTIRSLAAALEDRAGLDDWSNAPIERADRATELPLSLAQERIWFLNRLDPDSSAYNIPRAVRIRGPFDVAALETAYRGLIERHEVLRSAFPSVGGRPVQVISPGTTFQLGHLDVSAHPEEERERRLRELLLDQSRRPFDVDRGPLLRAMVVRMQPDEVVLVQLEHHLVHDGWTQGILMGELLTLYRRAVGEPLPELPPLSIQYADYAVWQRRWLDGERTEKQLAYWRQRLQGIPELLQLPTDRPRPPRMSNEGGEVRALISADLADRIRAAAREEGCTLYMFMLAAFYVLVRRYTGQEDICVGAGIANRSHPQVEPLLGMFINTIALRTQVEEDMSFQELLRRVRETCLGAYSNSDVPFERVVEATKIPRSLAHLPVAQVLFSFMDAPSPALDIPGLSLSSVAFHNRSSKADINIVVIPRAEQHVGSTEAREIQVLFEFATDLFETDTARRMLSQLLEVLDDASRDRLRPIGDLRLLPEEEEELVLRRWAVGGAPEIDEPTLGHQLFERAAAAHADAIAVVRDDTRWTYRELDRRANAIAQALLAAGAPPGAIVGLLLDRTPDMVAAVLGALKAGVAYVPMDAGLPDARIAQVVEAAEPWAVMTRGSMAGRLPPATEVIDVDLVPRASAEAPPPRVDRSALAYVVFTSGSTGLPKGVAVEHRALVAFQRWAETMFSEDEARAVPFVSSIGFDASIFDMFVPLSRGGRVVMGDNGLDLPAICAAENISLAMIIPPSLMAELLRGTRSLGIGTILVGGEALPPALADTLAEASGARRVMNVYGPTETTVLATADDIVPGQVVAIGRPLGHVRTFVLDSRMRPLPIGVPGELYIGGGAVARGYLGRPDLTAEKFVPDPFSRRAGDRLYRSGDVVRWLPHGRLEFIGRADHQVKIRGFRIELGDVESALRRHPGVAEAAVVARDDAYGKMLVAFVTAKTEAHLEEADLRAHCAALLPHYMAPASVVVLDRMPLNNNGKLDRARLPGGPSRSERGGARTPPRTALERVLVGMVGDLLGLPAVGIEESFFDIGGHSLVGLQLISRVSEALGMQVPVHVVFEQPTVEGMARALTTLHGDAVEEAAELVLQVEALSEADAARLLGDQESPGSDA